MSLTVHALQTFIGFAELAYTERPICPGAGLGHTMRDFQASWLSPCNADGSPKSVLHGLGISALYIGAAVGGGWAMFGGHYRLIDRLQARRSARDR